MSVSSIGPAVVVPSYDSKPQDTQTQNNKDSDSNYQPPPPAPLPPGQGTRIDQIA